jgi:hypothetical protein
MAAGPSVGVQPGSGITSGLTPPTGIPAGTERGYGGRRPISPYVLERLNSPLYFAHLERFLKRPALNADIVPTNLDPTQAQFATILAANLDWEVVGTNATTALCTFAEGGGITLTTAGADGDEMILQTHRDTNQSALFVQNWGSARLPLFQLDLVTGANITNAIIWAGFKLTSTEVVATDDDQFAIRYEDDVNGGRWQLITSNAGVDDTDDSGIAVAVSTVYQLRVEVGADMIPVYTINNTIVGVGPALRVLTTFDPYAGVAADGAAAAKAITARQLLISQSR